jgi:hypothetical protein
VADGHGRRREEAALHEVPVVPRSDDGFAELLDADQLRRYRRALRDGAINARPRVEPIRSRAATAVLDADNGLGVVVGQHAMDLAVALVAWLSEPVQGGDTQVMQTVADALGCDVATAEELIDELCVLGVVGTCPVGTDQIRLEFIARMNRELGADFDLERFTLFTFSPINQRLDLLIDLRIAIFPFLHNLGARFFCPSQQQPVQRCARCYCGEPGGKKPTVWTQKHCYRREETGEYPPEQ